MKGPLIYYEIKDMFGTDLSNTTLATQLGKDIMGDIDLGFNVELDFEGVRSITNGWARNAIGTIAKEHGVDFVKSHILISNISKNVRKTILEGTGDILI